VDDRLESVEGKKSFGPSALSSNYHEPGATSVLVQAVKNQFTHINIWITATVKLQFGSDIFIRLIKSLSISEVYPEDVGFRVFVVESVSVFNCDLRFSAVRCQHGVEIVGEETVPDASQSAYRNTKRFLKSLFYFEP
jgi:hypothetical protein